MNHAKTKLPEEIKSAARLLIDACSKQRLLGKWGSEKEACQILNVGPKTLAKMRDQKMIKYSERPLGKRTYDLHSCDEYNQKYLVK